MNKLLPALTLLGIILSYSEPKSSDYSHMNKDSIILYDKIVGSYKGFGPGRRIAFKADRSVSVSMRNPGSKVALAKTSWEIEEDEICFDYDIDFIQLAIKSEDLFEHFNYNMCVKYFLDNAYYSNGEVSSVLVLYLNNLGKEYKLELVPDD